MIKPAWGTYMSRTCPARISSRVKLLLFLATRPFTFHFGFIWIPIGFSEWCRGGSARISLTTWAANLVTWTGGSRQEIRQDATLFLSF